MWAAGEAARPLPPLARPAARGGDAAATAVPLALAAEAKLRRDLASGGEEGEQEEEGETRSGGGGGGSGGFIHPLGSSARAFAAAGLADGRASCCMRRRF